MRAAIGAVLLSLVACAGPSVPREEMSAGESAKYVRFRKGQTTAYGLVEGERVRQLTGTRFGAWEKTDMTFALSEVKLLPPTQPRNVLAMAGNYKSHHAGETIDPKFEIPQLFYKSVSSLAGQSDNIVIPTGTQEVHYEAELVVVIGKRAKNVPAERALEFVFGVTCGNDVSARDWQKTDVQWWRAKGSDTFGPVGPWIVTGLNPDDLEVQMRVNGEVKQKQRTRDLIHSVAKIVSFASQHLTLQPGDLIFTGTPGKTSAIKPGDLCEVEIEGIGVLKNKVVAGP